MTQKTCTQLVCDPVPTHLWLIATHFIRFLMYILKILSEKIKEISLSNGLLNRPHEPD